MSGPTPRAVLGLLRSQLFVHPLRLTSSFKGQTIVVTGGNAGLGKAAVQLLVELDAARVIMACRTPAKGEEAKTAIETAVKRAGVIQVWQLDLADYTSILAFGERLKTLDRLDAVIENAGVWPTKHATANGHELTLLTNVISTFLLAHLCLPKLRESAKKHNTTSRLTVVGSQLHKFATLTARKDAGDLITALDKQQLTTQAEYDARYYDTKLLVQSYVQRLATEHQAKHGDDVCINGMNPGYCLSALKPATDFGTKMAERALARTTEQGAFTLVDAVALEKAAGRNAQYVDDMRVKAPAVWLSTEDGKQTGERLWRDLNAVIDGVEPGLTTRL